MPQPSLEIATHRDEPIRVATLLVPASRQHRNARLALLYIIEWRSSLLHCNLLSPPAYSSLWHTLYTAPEALAKITAKVTAHGTSLMTHVPTPFTGPDEENPAIASGRVTSSRFPPTELRSLSPGPIPAKRLSSVATQDDEEHQVVSRVASRISYGQHSSASQAPTP
ncbi:hypothetical protein NUW58_g1491 [Xylaria curta]|uniref:Uncharacterized protein n=1 Tax=Xylaria curta TaxID=42375 RepID=A0ACC1PLL1_9PEZI|nr:hypothetical protein NUW58_g1491 [Xylaria curta]